MEEQIKCKPAEHLYIPITWESYQEGLKAMQKALAVMCEKCLDIKYITEVGLKAKQAKNKIPEVENTIKEPIVNENTKN